VTPSGVRGAGVSPARLADILSALIRERLGRSAGLSEVEGLGMAFPTIPIGDKRHRDEAATPVSASLYKQGQDALATRGRDARDTAAHSKK
jgi:hypothetical protein